MAVENIFPNAAQIDTQNSILARIANKMGAYSEPLTYAALQAEVRSGNIRAFLQEKSQITVEHNSTLTATSSGDGITSVNVDGDKFLTAAGTGASDYEFSFDGTWHYSGSAVTLADYGITITGTAASGDSILVHRTASSYDYDVDAIDIEQPANPYLEHSLSIGMHSVYSLLNFDPPMYLYAVTADKWPSGMPAGTYHFTLDHGAYGGGTTQDGTYQFTTTQTIPVGGGIRHTTLGVYRSDSNHSKENLLSGKFITYNADTFTTLESGIQTVEGNAGTNLGTTTARDPQYKDGENINFTERQGHGTNRWRDCYLRQVLNSEDKVFRWEKKTIFSRNLNITAEGFLHTIDPELRAVLGKVRRRYALSILDGYGYDDLEDYVTLYTMLDVFSQKNNNISEGPVDAEGNVTHTSALPLWDGSTDEERVKRQNSTPRAWWLASPYPSYCSERFVYSSGALYYSHPSYSRGVVPRLHII